MPGQSALIGEKGQKKFWRLAEKMGAFWCGGLVEVKGEKREWGRVFRNTRQRGKGDEGVGRVHYPDSSFWVGGCYGEA